MRRRIIVLAGLAIAAAFWANRYLSVDQQATRAVEEARLAGADAMQGARIVAMMNALGSNSGGWTLSSVACGEVGCSCEISQYFPLPDRSVDRHWRITVSWHMQPIAASQEGLFSFWKLYRWKLSEKQWGVAYIDRTDRANNRFARGVWGDYEEIEGVRYGAQMIPLLTSLSTGVDRVFAAEQRRSPIGGRS